jgi:hypothetical protein
MEPSINYSFLGIYKKKKKKKKEEDLFGFVFKQVIFSGFKF